MSRQLHLGLNTPSLGTYKSAWQAPGHQSERDREM